MEKKSVLFLLSVLFAFTFISSSNAMFFSGLFSACSSTNERRRVANNSEDGEPDHKRRKAMQKSENITRGIKVSSTLLGQKFKKTLESVLQESFSNVKVSLIQENQVGKEVLRVINQTLEMVLKLFFSGIDATISDIAGEKRDIKLEKVIMDIFAAEISKVNALAKAQFQDTSGQKRIVDIIMDLLSGKAVAEIEQQAKSQQPVKTSNPEAAADAAVVDLRVQQQSQQSEIDLKKLEKDAYKFLAENAESIKTSTDILGLVLIVLGRMAPMLPEISERLIKEIPAEFQGLISEMGRCFAEQVVIVMDAGEQQHAQAVMAMKTLLCEKFVNLLKEKIFKKIVGILNPYINVVVNQAVEEHLSFLPNLIKPLACAGFNSLISKAIENGIEGISKKIQQLLINNNKAILDELDSIILQIIAAA